MRTLRTAAILAVCATVAAALAGGAAGRQSPTPGLDKVHRVFVQSFGDDPASQQFQALVVTALVKTGRFVVTEDATRADAVLKGSGLERSSHEVHAFGESTSVGSAAAAASANNDGAAAAAVGRHMGVGDSQLDTQTVEHASVALRLVGRDGDVLWSASNQSDGGKYAGASQDAVEQCIKQLVRDADRAAAAAKQ